MTASRQEMEALLVRDCERQTAHYRQALGLTEDLLTVDKPGHDFFAGLQQIVVKLQQVATENAAAEALKQAWRQCGQTRGPTLNAALAALAHEIERLAKRISELQRRATAGRDALLPEIDHLVRATQMQKAYAHVAAGTKRRAGA